MGKFYLVVRIVFREKDSGLRRRELRKVIRELYLSDLIFKL